MSSIKKNIDEQREQSVVKANELIQNTRFNLSAQEQKIILYLISKIKPDDTEFQEYSFDIKDFCKVCGIDYTNGKNYQDLKDAIKNLHDKSVWIKTDEKTEVLFSWVSGATIFKDNGVIKVRLNERMKPYLLQLQKKFTQYQLIYTLGMKSQYSIRIYEMLKSYENLHEKTFTVDELKQKLMCERQSYKNFNNFKTYVLDMAVKEINALTDISVEYKIAKEGKKVAQIHFTINQKKDITERLKTFAEIKKLLNK